ncbi:MAG: DNA polymerase I [Marinilabiliales bacterium]|nr:MAG: DNA polymerase I [Marinilabiliales bacterium]
MSENKPTLFLLDAMALAYRAYYAFIKNPITNSKGMNTSAVMGFANTLMDILLNEKPSHIGVAFDTKAPTTRHDEFAFYKANRESMPDDLSISIPYIKKLIEVMGIPVIEMPGYEADDIIGTLAKEAEKKDFTVYMMTPDKDFGQLVSENIFMYKPAKGGNKAEVWGIPEVCEKFGIERPDQVIDILAIWGDASDNIPGIPGIGEVGAKKLIAQFGSLEEAIERAEEIDKPAMKKKVQENTESALLSKQLATIITDVPITFMPSELEWKVPSFPPIKELFDEMEFRTLTRRVQDAFYKKKEENPGAVKGQNSLFDQDFIEGGDEESSSYMNSIQKSTHKYNLITKEDQLNSLVEKLEKAEMCCFDTESTSLDTLTAELVGIAFSTKVGAADFVYLKDKDFAVLAKEKLTPVFANDKISKCGHNLKYDIGLLRSHEIEIKGQLIDTMLAHYLLHPEMKHSLDYLSETYLDYQTIHFDQLVGKKDASAIWTVEPSKLCDYACEDVDITLQLWEMFGKELKDQDMEDLFFNLETPLIPVLEDMERSGVSIDTETLEEFSTQLQEEIKELEREIHTMAGHSFNVASPKQLGVVLFEELNIAEKPTKTKTKQYSTSEEVLQKYLHKHEIVGKVLDFRELSKLLNTYVAAFPKLIHPETGRVHTSYNQAVTATGRLSSSNPNLQNIPIRTERGREIRKTFVPKDENHVLLAADYSQIELRIIASISEDPGMMQAFNDGLDIHTATASRVYGSGVDEVSSEQRRHAKTVNFGIIYGISAFGLSERLGIARKEAADIIEEYFKQFPGIKKYMDDTIAQARETGYVETLMKRRRYLKDIHSTNSFVRGFAERNAINAPIQGSSADMIKIAMIKIHEAIEKEGLKSKMVLQVHDELVFEVPKEELDLIKPIIEREMKAAMELKVPVEIDMKEGVNWLQAH